MKFSCVETCENRKQQRTLNRRAFACAVFRRKRQVVACVWTNVPSSGRRSGLNRQTKGIEVKQAKNIKIRISIRLDSKRQPPAGFFFCGNTISIPPGPFRRVFVGKCWKAKITSRSSTSRGNFGVWKNFKKPSGAREPRVCTL